MWQLGTRFVVSFGRLRITFIDGPSTIFKRRRGPHIPNKLDFLLSFWTHWPMDGRTKFLVYVVVVTWNWLPGIAKEVSIEIQ